jgi:hypothetical protein
MPKGVYSVIVDLNCQVCNKIFKSQRVIAKYCGNICRNIDWRKNNRTRDYDTKHRWKTSNAERHRENQYAYRKKRLEEDLEYKLKQRIRSRLGRIKFNNSVRTLDWLGCSILELKKYLESKFQPGMTWDNYGCKGWHIDHIVPLSSFDLSDGKQLKIACNYMNLQPLWAIDNLKKSNKISDLHEEN